jgi:DnaK suppressor protein
VEGCPDETDFAAQLVQQGINIAMHRRQVARMHELETALKRLSETDYGICEECGEEIGVARLKANPSARLCVCCQSDLEDGLLHCA